MELTQSKIDDLLNGLILTAKDHRAKIPYSKTDSFSNTLVFVGPDCEGVVQAITWGNENEKYAKMRAVSEVAKQMFCQAVVLITDVRWVEHTQAEKVLGLPRLDDVGLETWSRMYRHEIMTRYKGYLGNAPPELYGEAVMAIMKGPMLRKVHTRMAPYEKGENDSIRWLPPKDNHSSQHFNLLPDWWC